MGRKDATNRNPLDLGHMLRHETGKVGCCYTHPLIGCFPYFPLKYGCHCGLGGVGDAQPVDEFDALCKTHDVCYASDSDCDFFDLFIKPIEWYIDSNDQVISAVVNDSIPSSYFTDRVQPQPSQVSANEVSL